MAKFFAAEDCLRDSSLNQIKKVNKVPDLEVQEGAKQSKPNPTMSLIQEYMRRYLIMIRNPIKAIEKRPSRERRSDLGNSNSNLTPLANSKPIKEESNKLEPLKLSEIGHGVASHKENSRRFGKINRMYVRGFGGGFDDGIKPRHMDYFNHFPIGAKNATQSLIPGSS